MNRRGFMAAILAAAAAPAVCKAVNLMPVRQLDSGLLLPEWELEDVGTWGGARTMLFSIRPVLHTLGETLSELNGEHDEDVKNALHLLDAACAVPVREWAHPDGSRIIITQK